MSPNYVTRSTLRLGTAYDALHYEGDPGHAGDDS
jgi:hypothetical protein